jgi:hypothetical protein
MARQLTSQEGNRANNTTHFKLWGILDWYIAHYPDFDEDD